MHQIVKLGVLSAMLVVALPQVRPLHVAPPTNLASADAEFAGEVSNGLLRDVARLPLETVRPEELALAIARLSGEFDAPARFDILRRAAEAPADTFVAALEAVAEATSWTDGDNVAGRDESISAAKERITRLGREDAAAATWHLEQLERATGRRQTDDEWRVTIEGIIGRFPGTETARSLEVLRFTNVYPYEKQIEQLETFARARPRSVEAARAWYEIGFQLGSNMGTSGERVNRADHLMKAIAVATELQAGAYPPNRWSDQAVPLVTGFFISERHPLGPQDIDRCLDGFRDFIGRNLQGSPSDQFAYVIDHTIRDLCQRKGAGAECVDGFVASLDAPDHHDGARFVAAMRQASLARAAGQPSDRMAFDRAVAQLTALARDGGEAFRRRAQSELAALLLFGRDYTRASAAYRRLLEIDADNPWNWIVVLRLGQALEGTGDWSAAETAYVDVLKRGGAVKAARVVAHERVARLAERRGDFARALAEHQEALENWEPSFGEGISWQRAERNDPAHPEPWRDDFTQIDLDRQVRALRESLSVEGGEAFERIRPRGSRPDWATVRDAADRVVGEYRGKRVAAQAYELSSQARFELALEWYAAGDREAALAWLVALAQRSRGPFVFGARLALAADMAFAGRKAEAERQTRQVLQDWARHSAQDSSPVDPLVRDIVGIRSAVMLPDGGGIYGARDWNAYSWPMTPPPFAVVDRTVTVRLASGDLTEVIVPPAMLPSRATISLRPGDVGIFASVVSRIGGAETRAPRGASETPNQPIGRSMEIVDLWGKLFPCRPGHWGGWEFFTYPQAPEIDFLDAARTKALARVVIGYSGATVALEKQGGIWVATKIDRFWVT